MIKTLLLSACTLLFCATLSAQRPLTHEDLVTWRQISNARLSADGNYATWQSKGEKTDPITYLYDLRGKKVRDFQRAEGARFSADGKFLSFKMVAARDTVLAQRRRKVEKEDLPKDTLVIFEIGNKNLVKIPEVKSFKMPEKWNDYLVYHREPRSKEEMIPEDGQTTKVKAEGKKTGSRLTVRHLGSGEEMNFGYVTDFRIAEEGPQIVFESTGDDSTFLAGLYRVDFDRKEAAPLFRAKGDFQKITLSDNGKHIAFLADLDTTTVQVRPFGLYYWNGKDTARALLTDYFDSRQRDWRISENGSLSFSENNERLFFGTAPMPLLQDTSLLPEEIVDVEVWTTNDAKLYTQQNVQLKDEQKRSYRAVYDLKRKTAVQLADERLSDLRLLNEGKADHALGIDDRPYFKARSYEGWPGRRDLYRVDMSTGKQTLIERAVFGTPQPSPQGRYALYFHPADTVWRSLDLQSGATKTLTNNLDVPFYDELNDRPMYPGSYGIAAWGPDDKWVLLNDRYDLWKVWPDGSKSPKRITRGREEQRTYRYMRLDREERFLTDDDILVHVFDHRTKGSGYARLDIDDAKMSLLLFDDNYRYTNRPIKATGSDRMLIRKENFSTFPELYATDTKLKNPVRISSTAPQQNQIAWGSVELYEWTGTEGERMTGMLAKPANFDPNKQYPMIVNFYERSSDRLHGYPRPYPGRSTINYAYYTSNGYLIFNPDVPYRVGYPGESAYNAVMSGVTSLIDEGFVDREKIGLQGHSWGGYQIAHIVTKTDLFACAESGAPVVNMTSAYGGIRWGSGLVRQFQYEKTQSRIGGTLWETPLRYLENSPLFFTDKINTPLLIMHNDEDGHVPWYQGIEWFNALRRLDKPAWFLNYRGEPHWPVKQQNRIDFQIRMAQFFDHFLKDSPMPSWMQRGVPATERGILQGLELGSE